MPESMAHQTLSTPVGRRILSAFTPVLATIAFVGVLAAATPLSNAQAAIERIVAVINDEPIMQSELETAVREIIQDLRRRKAKIPGEEVLIRQTLESIIRERVLLQVAAERNVRVSPREIDNALVGVAQRNNLSPRDFRSALDREGIDFAAYRASLEDRLRVQRLVDRQMESQIVVTEEEIDLQVAATGTDTATTEFDLSRILISVPPGADNSQLELVRGRAELVLDRIRENFAFEDAAAEFSSAPDALKGGRIGWRKSGQLPALYLGALVGMKAGEVSDLVRGPNGFHILKLHDRRNDDQKIVQQVELRQILLRPAQNRADEDTVAKLALLRERIVGGEEFGAIASAHTEDPISQSTDGVVGWVSLEELPASLREPVTRLKPGEISDIVRTPFGYHLLSYTNVREQDITDEIRRNKARQEIYTRKSEQYYDDWVRELRDRAYVEYRIGDR